MPDHRHQLQQLLDHPLPDADLPPGRAFTDAVMARVQLAARPPGRRMRVLPWCLAAGALAAGILLPGSWPGDEGDPLGLADAVPALDLLAELIAASLAAGALLLVGGRRLA